jgi:hypothetical protein
MIALWACAPEPPPVPEPEPEVLQPALPPSPEPPPRNQPPIITAVTLSPESIDTNVSAQVAVQASDPAGRRPTPRFRWTVNDRRIVDAVSDTLNHEHYQKGDDVTVYITVYDGTDEHEQSLSFTVQNSPPAFLTDPRSLDQLDGFQVKTIDPDGDTVTYRMEGAPRGMDINSRNGTIRYVGSVDDPGGEYDVKIIAEDDSSGSVTWTFSIAVQAGSGTP